MIESDTSNNIVFEFSLHISAMALHAKRENSPVHIEGRHEENIELSWLDHGRAVHRCLQQQFPS
ncbi:MAG: hypothetical protein AAF633_17575 [Chloroflexota bacterium]